MGDDVKTRIRPDGLRYESKASGSEFPSWFGATMSCFCCGRHLPRSRMKMIRVAGCPQFRCKDGC